MNHVDPFYLKFQVTKADLEDGQPCSNLSCPVGLALRRALRKKFRRWRSFDVVVTKTSAILIVRKAGGETREARSNRGFSGDLSLFVEAFDQGGSVAGHPFLEETEVGFE